MSLFLLCLPILPYYYATIHFDIDDDISWITKHVLVINLWINYAFFCCYCLCPISIFSHCHLNVRAMNKKRTKEKEMWKKKAQEVNYQHFFFHMYVPLWINPWMFTATETTRQSDETFFFFIDFSRNLTQSKLPCNNEKWFRNIKKECRNFYRLTLSHQNGWKKKIKSIHSNFFKWGT